MNDTLQIIQSLYPVSETPFDALGIYFLILFPVVLVAFGLFCLFSQKTQYVKSLATILTVATVAGVVGGYNSFIPHLNNLQVQELSDIADGKTTVKNVVSNGRTVWIDYTVHLGDFAGQQITTSERTVIIPLEVALRLNEQVFQPKGIALAVNR